MAKKKKRGLKEALDQAPVSRKDIEDLNNIQKHKDIDKNDRRLAGALLDILGYENTTNNSFLPSEYEFAENLIRKYRYPYLHNKGYEPEV